MTVTVANTLLPLNSKTATDCNDAARANCYYVEMSVLAVCKDCARSVPACYSWLPMCVTIR